MNHTAAEHRDELPDDLNATEFVGPYKFPDNARRRVPGALYIAAGLITAVLAATLDSSAVNRGLLYGAIALIIYGLFCQIAGWKLNTDENDALVIATKSVGFPVGHASAQMRWRGLLSKPVWQILLYSNEKQPKNRGLVQINAHDGSVIEQLVQDNPEDFSKYEAQAEFVEQLRTNHSDTQDQNV